MVLGSSIHSTGWILVASLATLSGCSQHRAVEERPAAPELRLEGVRFRLYRGEAIRADGTAAEVTFQRDSTAVAAADMAMRMRDARGDVLLTAPVGTGIVSARTFEASGGVRAVRGDDTAETESARFDPTAAPRGLVIGDRPVVLTGKGYRLSGNGFTLDPAVGEIALRGGTRLVAGTGARR
jgi:hypothetical protein